MSKPTKYYPLSEKGVYVPGKSEKLFSLVNQVEQGVPSGSGYIKHLVSKRWCDSGDNWDVK